jgi:outer membrane receptor protein involved in Fe transport
MKAISLIGAGVAAALLGVATDAGAQAAAPTIEGTTGLEEIVVTANRREQNLQDVGTSIAAFTGEQIRNLQVITAADIAFITPNVDLVRSYAGPGFNTQITIRGVGQPDFSDTTEATATTYVDEFYMIGAGQADFLLFDLERVEVARGPQGTVQGRNSTAGSINYYTARPDVGEVAGKASLTMGENRLVRTEAFVNVPLADTVAVRASIATDYNQGYVRNINEERLFDKGGTSDFMAGRLQFLFEPSDTFSLNIKGEYGESGPVVSNEEALQTGPIEGRVGTFRVDADAFGQNDETMGTREKGVLNTVGANRQNADMTHILARADWTLSDAWTLVGLGGWLKSNKDEVETCDHTPLPICLFSNKGESEHYMFEVRTNYDAGNGFRLTAGANYLDQTIDSRSATPLFFSPEITPFEGGMYTQTFHDQQDLTSYAVFGQGEWDFADAWTLIAGVRYTRDDKEIDAFNAVSITIPLTEPLPRNLGQFLRLGDLAVADPSGGITTLNRADNGNQAVFDKGLVNAVLQLNYRLSDDVLLYGSIRQGQKGGGFISGNAAGTPPELRKYDEDTNTAYEFGFKSTLLDGTTRLNGAVFYYDYADMQNLTLINITNVIGNNDTTVFGGEIEIASRPIENFDISAGIGYLDTEVEGIFNPVGDVAATFDAELPLAPSITANLKARYYWSVGAGNQFWVQGVGRYRDEIWRDSLNNQSTLIEASSQVDAQVGYGPEDDKWSVVLWVNNVFDSRDELNAFDLSGVGNTGEIVYQAPRWFGATFTAKF